MSEYKGCDNEDLGSGPGKWVIGRKLVTLVNILKIMELTGKGNYKY